MCLKYAVTAALNNENIGKHPQRIAKIRLFIDQCDWKMLLFRFYQAMGDQKKKDKPKFQKKIQSLNIK